MDYQQSVALQFRELVIFTMVGLSLVVIMIDELIIEEWLTRRLRLRWSLVGGIFSGKYGHLFSNRVLK